MDHIAFTPLIDLPLAGVLLLALLWHFGRWAQRDDLETNIDVAARLPAARLRVTALIVAVVLLCWLANLAVWGVFLLFFGAGLAFALISGGDVDGSTIGLLAAVYLIREWSFGFPELVLHPERRRPEGGPSSSREMDHDLVGQTGFTVSPLRPSGDAEISGRLFSVVSEDGRWVDARTQVIVTSCRNGRPVVRPTS